MPSLKEFYITLGDINFLIDQMRDAIKIIGYDSQSNAIYGFTDSAGMTQTLGVFGSFTQNGQSVSPLEVIDPVTGLSIYDGAREASGFRVPSGLFNNLVDLTRWTWGSTNQPFPRLTVADYDHYVAQVTTNPALTNPGHTGYVDTHPDVADPNATTTLATAAAYADLNKSVVDYTPRMITQTISSSYGAPHAAAATSTITANGTDAAQTIFAPGELLLISVGGKIVAFQFYDGSTSPAPLTGTVGIDVRVGPTPVTVNAALTAIQAGLVATGGDAAVGATVRLDATGHIGISLATPAAGDLAVFDYAGLGLGGTYSASVAATNSALIRTGAYTDVFVSENVITGANPDGTFNHATITEYVARNLNTLPGDPSTSGIFTLFGQFFDHGLDFIDKGGQGAKIIIPLAPSDPLYRAPGMGGPSDPGNTTITISRATPDSYTVTDAHGRPVSIAGADNTWGTADDLSAPGADGVYGTADDMHGAVTKPTGPTTYTDHTSPYIDQSQSYGSISQTTDLLREWVKNPNFNASLPSSATNAEYIPGSELLDGHQTVAYHSTTFNDATANGLNATGQLADGVSTRTVPTLNELRAHLLATGRDDITWDDVNNYRERDANGRVIDTNGAAVGGNVYTGEGLVLDFNPRFDAAHLQVSDGNAATTWDSSAAAKVNAAITYMNAHMGDVGRAGDVLSFGVNPATGAQELALTLGSALPTGPTSSIPGGVTVYGAYAVSPWVNFANFSIAVPTETATGNAFYNAVGELMMSAIGDHYIAGDGRANENFGLTSLHHVFHENHNVQLASLEANILAQADEGHRQQYQVAVTVKAGDPSPAAGITVVGGHYQDAAGNFTLADGAISWDQEKMFQATKLINEMEYQHVAIDQYARLVTPDLPEFVTYDSDINADISLEYSQAAFRFGHSQLRDTIDTIDPNGLVTKWALSAAFLNPEAYKLTGAENILRGMSHQLSNDVDEFVTPALQQSLLGQSLDLGAINIARGRDVGMPTLNEVRRQLHDALIAERAADPTTPHHTNLIVDALNPYTSWAEYGSQMQHSESLVNFIAAYAFDGNLENAQEIVDLESGVIASGSGANHWTTQDAVNFLNNSMGNLPTQLAAGANAFNNIDFWIGGLSELHVFTGQLGTTFNAIFEDQMERLMDGDRFYYLYRLQDALNIDTDLGHAIATEQFKDIIERTTGILHLNGDVMGYADSYVELDKTHATDLANPANAGLGIYSGSGNGTAGNGTILSKANTDLGFVGQKYIADFRPDTGENPDGTPASGYNSHEVLSGTDFNDWIDAGNGDDTVYGDKGDDVLDGKAGADHLYGGDGQDVLYGGDIEDFLDGGEGDDIVYAGTSAGALDVVIGGNGNDKLYGEAGIDEIYGGAGDDYIDAGGDTDLAFGDAGNDIIFGGDGPDELRGGLGSDQLSGGSGADVLKGEGGDDIMFGGIGQNAQNGDGDELLGDVGFDLAAFSDVNIVLDAAADLRNQNLVAAGGAAPFNPFGQLFADLEGIVGSKFADKIIGDDTDNWLIGGGGGDTFNTTIATSAGAPSPEGTTGSGGNDVIIGDSIRLDTLVGKYAGYTGGFDANGNALHGFTGTLSDGLLGNAALGTQMFEKHFTELLQSERNKDFVLGSDGGAAGSDTAIFTGKLSEYKFESINITAANGETVNALKITDNGGLVDDGTGTLVPRANDGIDLLVGVEVGKFADQTISLVATPPALDLDADHIVTSTTNPYRDNFATQAFTNSNGTLNWATTPWVETGDNGGTSSPSAGQITITGGGLGVLRMGDNGDGASIQRTTNLSGATAATVSFDYSEFGFNTNETVTALFSDDGSFNTGHLQTIQTINSNSNLFQNVSNVALQGSLSASSAIRFVVSGGNSSGGFVAVDNLRIDTSTSSTVSGAPGTGHISNYQEGGARVAISAFPSITDDSATMASAKVALTDAVAGDTLRIGTSNATNGNLGGGVTYAIDSSVAGQVTLTMTGQASKAQYQGFIDQVRFFSTSDNPTAADRTVSVTVNDGLWTSNVATTTIHVAPVNDAPTANADYIVTNQSTVVVAESLLLANDTDLDGPGPLDITATIGLNSLTSASLTTNPGSVTIIDPSTGPAGGSFTYIVSDGGSPVGTDTANVTVTRVTGTNINQILGATGVNANRAEILIGGNNAENFNGGGGSDTVLAGGGDDQITYAVTTGANNSVTSGRDFIDGGTTALDSNGRDTGSDRFILNGTNVAETFKILTRQAAVAAGIVVNNTNTEIVVTRQTGNNIANTDFANLVVLAELDNIEEITVNTTSFTTGGVNAGGSAGSDAVQVVGNFGTLAAPSTSLNFNTITVNDQQGGSTVDISGLTSEHRIVFHTNADGHFIGDVRPQDIIDTSGLPGATNNTTPPQWDVATIVGQASLHQPKHIHGANHDTFVFKSSAQANGSSIEDFAAGDRIDLHKIDANSGARGNNAFHFGDGVGFTSAGELIVHYDADHDQTIVTANTDENLQTAEFQFTIAGDHVNDLKHGGIIL